MSESLYFDHRIERPDVYRECRHCNDWVECPHCKDYGWCIPEGEYTKHSEGCWG